jgi:HSP20 family protein
MKDDTKKGNMEVAVKTPEMVNPFQMMRRFTKAMERLFEDFGGFSFQNFFKTDLALFRMELDKGEWLPQIEVLQNNGQFTVRADLPGLTKDDVTIEVTDDVLTLSGERKEEKEEKREGFYRSERNYGSFYRQTRNQRSNRAKSRESRRVASLLVEWTTLRSAPVL